MPRSLALAGFVGLCMTPAGLAQSQDDPLAPILDCRAIEADAERLACFDAAAAALSGEVETGEVLAVTRQDVEAVERDSFGFNMPSLPRLSLGLLGGGGDAEREEDAPSPAAVGIADADETEETRIVERSEDGQVDRIVMTIESVREFRPRRQEFTMANGQVWRQTYAERVRIPRVRDGQPNTAEIRRAAMGSFLLRINGTGSAVRVMRVR